MCKTPNLSSSAYEEYAILDREDLIMKAGAVIVSAGLSSRMGAFKPMLPFGSETIIRHNALSLLNAGCSPVCIVTGFKSDLLKEHLSDLPVICIENQIGRAHV